MIEPNIHHRLYPIIHLPLRLLVHLMCRRTTVAWPLLLVLRCTDEGMLS